MPHIRPATPLDSPWITALAPRLHAFGPPPWREVAIMDAAVAEGLARDLANPPAGSAIFAAVDDAGTPLGFVSVRTDPDYFTGRPCGHVTDIVVSPDAEGQGVGQLLLDAAECWARDLGYPWITLHVFAENHRAKRVYERTGYGVEWHRMLKRLD